MRDSTQPFIQLLQEALVFAALTASIIVLHRHNWFLLAVLCLLLIAVVTHWHRRSDVVCLLVIGSLGTAAEVLFVRFGVWRYANPSWLGVPVWFPISFGLAGLVGLRVTRSVTTLWVHVADRE
jgi:uncharacterized membrane protein YoaT (DUF817 family)